MTCSCYSFRFLTPMLLLLTLLGSAQRSMAADTPNIVIIVGDDMGYADVGFHGCQDVPTPHLDALAAAGVRCTNGYVSGPLLFADAGRASHRPLPDAVWA